MWVVIFGDAIRGYEYHGPFETEKDAMEYGDANRGAANDEFWLAPIEQEEM